MTGSPVPATAAATGAWTLFGRNGAHLFFCFVGSALLNVLSQSAFAQLSPATKDTWLSAALLVGTVASIAGVRTAAPIGFGRSPRGVGSALVVIVTVMFGTSLFAHSAAWFALLCVCVRFVLQYGTQEIDRRAMLLAGDVDRQRNDALGTGLRFGGMLLGPLWFGLVTPRSIATVSMLVAMGVLGLISVWLVALAPGHDTPMQGKAPTDAARNGVTATGTMTELSGTDRTLLAGARAIYAAFYLLASSLIYVLSDVHHAPDARTHGAMLIALVYASAIAATAFEMSRRRTTARSPLEMLPAPLLVLGAAVGLPHAAMLQGAFAWGGACLLGLAFARFLLAFRDHASRGCRERPALLVAYNNLANTSALLGYATMAVLTFGAARIGGAFVSMVSIGLSVLGTSAVAFVLVAVFRGRGAGAVPRVGGA